MSTGQNALLFFFLLYHFFIALILNWVLFFTIYSLFEASLYPSLVRLLLILSCLLSICQYIISRIALHIFLLFFHYFLPCFILRFINEIPVYIFGELLYYNYTYFLFKHIKLIFTFQSVSNLKLLIPISTNSPDSV